MRAITCAYDRVAIWHEATPQRFTTDYQHIGSDYFPTDVISHYMIRKETGFGDEKAPLYELHRKPPLSQQVTDNGYEKPVELFTDGKSGYIGDGHHRIDTAHQLGLSHVPVQVNWRTPDPQYPMCDNAIEPWLKGWLTDMRRGRQTASRRIALTPWPHTPIQPSSECPSCQHPMTLGQDWRSNHLVPMGYEHYQCPNCLDEAMVYSKSAPTPIPVGVL